MRQRKVGERPCSTKLVQFMDVFCACSVHAIVGFVQYPTYAPHRRPGLLAGQACVYPSPWGAMYAVGYWTTFHADASLTKGIVGHVSTRVHG